MLPGARWPPTRTRRGISRPVWSVYHYCRAPAGHRSRRFRRILLRGSPGDFVWPPAFEVMQAVAYILLGFRQALQRYSWSGRSAQPRPSRTSSGARRIPSASFPRRLALLVLLNPLIMRYESWSWPRWACACFSTLAVFAFVEYVVDSTVAMPSHW